MAIDMTGFYKAYDICAGKPAVGQNVFEPDLVFDCSPYHLFGKLNLGHPVFALSFLIHVRVAFKTPASPDFLVAEAVAAILSGFSHKREVKQQLRLAVGYSHEKAFEPQYTFMLEMGKYPADIFHRLTRLVKVRVIYYKTGILTMGVSPHPYLVPPLRGYTSKSLSPSHQRIGNKAVEHIFPGIDENFYRRVLDVENIFHTQIRQQQQILENRQRPVKSVTSVFYSKRALFGHPNP